MSFKQWLLSEGFKTFPPSHYLYKETHLIMLAVVIIFTLSLSLIFKNKSKKSQNIVLNILVFMMLFLEIVNRIIVMIKIDSYTFDNVYKALMPCHFSSIIAVFIIVAHFFKKQAFRNALTVGGILGSLAFLVHPAVGINADKILFTQMYSIVTHCLSFFIPVLWMVFKRVDFSLKKIHHTLIFFMLSIFYALFLNLLLFPGSNYMYFMKNELAIDVNIHLYRFVMVLIFIALITSFYLKDTIRVIKKKKINKSKT